MYVPHKLTEEMKEEHEMRLAAPHSFHVRKHDLEACGYTHGSPGCKSVLRGGTRQTHNETCRQRLLRKLRGDGRVKRHEERFDDYLAKTLEKEDKTRRKTDDVQKADDEIGRPSGSGVIEERQRGLEQQRAIY